MWCGTQSRIILLLTVLSLGNFEDAPSPVTVPSPDLGLNSTTPKPNSNLSPNDTSSTTEIPTASSTTTPPPNTTTSSPSSNTNGNTTNTPTQAPAVTIPSTIPSTQNSSASSVPGPASHESPSTSTEGLPSSSTAPSTTTLVPRNSTKGNSLKEGNFSGERGCKIFGEAISMKILIGEDDSVSVADLSKIRLPEFYIETSLYAYSVDYHYKKGLIFFTGNKSAIFRMRVPVLPTEGSPEKVIETVNGSISIAVDWIHDKIYWMNEDVLDVEMANLDGSNRTKLFINSNFEYPNNVVVDPYEKYLFIVMSKSIFRYRLDGKEQTVIQPDLEKEAIGRVKCLALDRKKKMLFFSGKNMAKKPYIASCAYNGSNAQIYEINVDAWNDFTGIDVFRDKIFFSNFEYGILDSLNTWDLAGARGSKGKTIYLPRTNSGEIWGIKVYHPSVQDPSYTATCLD